MRRSVRHALLLVLSLVSAGCAPFLETDVQLAIAGQDPLPPETLAPVEIRIYRSTVPDRPYRELGVAYVRAGTDLVDISARWREAAAVLGGDALIDMKMLSGGFIATVIAWTDEDEEGAAP